MKIKIIFYGLFLILAASVLGAAEITMNYSGTVTSTDANAVAISEVEVGDTVTGQFIFDTESQDEIPSEPLSGLYEAGSLTLKVRSFNYTTSDNNISITNDSVLVAGQPVLDAFEIVSGLRDVTGPSLSGLPPTQIDLVIVDTDAAVFTDDSLPTSLNVSEFEINSEEPFGTTGGRLIFQSLATGGIGEVRFRIDSITTADNPDNENEDNLVPEKIILASPSGTIEETMPDFTWIEDAKATWYKLYVSNPSTDFKFVQWYEIEDNFSTYPEVNCSEGECSISLDFELENGDYDWWVRGWNDNGNGPWSDGLNFEVQGDQNKPSKVTHTSPSGVGQDSMPTYTWVHDPPSTWYKLWIGYPNGERIFAQWYDASNICSENSCSVTLDLDLQVGEYEWYVKSWNEYDKIWSDGMGFTVTE